MWDKHAEINIHKIQKHLSYIFWRLQQGFLEASPASNFGSGIFWACPNQTSNTSKIEANDFHDPPCQNLARCHCLSLCCVVKSSARCIVGRSFTVIWEPNRIPPRLVEMNAYNGYHDQVYHLKVELWESSGFSKVFGHLCSVKMW